MLLILPAFEFGHSNDLVMRASIPPLFLLAFAFARLCASLLQANERSGRALAAGIIVLFGAATPGLEIARAFLPAFAISDCNFLTTWRKSAPGSNGANYLSRLESMPEWLVPGADHAASERETIEERRCWPDHPLLEESRK